MLDFLSQLHHLPRCGKDCLVPLFLPELNIEGPVRKTPFDQTRLPSGIVRIAHISFLCSVYDHSVVSLPNISGVPYFSASTYTGMRCTPRAVGAKTYQRLSCSTNAKK